MPLTVKVLSYKSRPLREQLSASFDREEGTLGRSSENHFILPDPEKFISHIHAIISYENGRYYLKDVSSNGTFVSNKNLRIHRDRVQLEDGDKLRIGDYDLLVSITDKSRNSDEPLLRAKNNPPHPVQSRGLPPDFDIADLLIAPENVEPNPIGSHSPAEHRVAPQHAPFEPSGVARSPEQFPELPPGFDIADLLTGPENVDQRLAENHSIGGRDVPPQHEAFEPPRVICPPEQSSELPTGFDIGGLLYGPDNAGEAHGKFESTEGVPPEASGVSVDNDVREISAPAHSKAVHESRDQASVDLFAVFLEGAGIQDTHFVDQEEIPELMRTAGALFREAVAGLAAILRGRAAAKSQMRIPVTIIQAVQNNPLKFSVADDTLKLLLTKSHPGYIDGVDAVREGCADVRNHELALTAGVQAAVNALLGRFHPDLFAKPYAEGLVLQRKAKCWDSYRQAYGKIVAEAQEDIFGDAFVQAYEEQIVKLRSRDYQR
jgi:type VI secretion system FHA domain protein